MSQPGSIDRVIKLFCATAAALKRLITKQDNSRVPDADTRCIFQDKTGKSARAECTPTANRFPLAGEGVSRAKSETDEI